MNVLHVNKATCSTATVHELLCRLAGLCLGCIVSISILNHSILDQKFDCICVEYWCCARVDIGNRPQVCATVCGMYAYILTIPCISVNYNHVIAITT